MNRFKLANAATWSANLTVIGLTALVVIAELVPASKNWLTSTFSHHWLGKGVLGILFFVLLTLVFTAVKPRDEARSLRMGLNLLSWVAALATVVLVGFFWYEAGR